MVCAVMHILFGIYIYGKEIEYGNFISVENTLVTFMFIFLSLHIWFQKNKGGGMINLLFWFLFEITVLFFRPEKTTLDIFHKYLPISQSCLLTIFGFLAIILSFIALYKQRKNNSL